MICFFFKAANHKPGNTIETNLKNLNVNQFDLAFEVGGYLVILTIKFQINYWKQGLQRVLIS